jgi:hypothetical protein
MLPHHKKSVTTGTNMFCAMLLGCFAVAAPCWAAGASATGGKAAGEVGKKGVNPADEEFNPADFNAVRVENEYKLTVPQGLADELWAHFNKKYAPGSPFYKELGVSGNMSATFSDEDFTDRYFDDENFTLLKQECSIRHRSRIVTSDRSNRKDGRQLVQYKMRRDGDLMQNRSEIKYPVEPNPGRDPLSLHPLVGLVARKYRDDFLKTGQEFGLDPTKMSNYITLDQRRRRVYMSRNGSPFATITLDEVRTEKWGYKLAWTEIELELNEILYTIITPEERDQMQAANDIIKADILKTYPAIFQDQTPKYNKAYNKFSAHFTAFPWALKLGMPVERVAIGVGVAVAVVVVGGVVWLVRRRAARRRGAVIAAPSAPSPQPAMSDATG